MTKASTRSGPRPSQSLTDGARSGLWGQRRTASTGSRQTGQTSRPFPSGLQSTETWPMVPHDEPVAIAAHRPGAIAYAVEIVADGKVVILYAQTTKLNDLHSHRRNLNSEEVERLKLFRSTEAAHQFLAARMLTRLFHARWLSCSPDDIVMTAREHYKPELILPERARMRDLPCFSISHSAGSLSPNRRVFRFTALQRAITA